MPKKVFGKRSPAQREKDRVQVAEWYSEGMEYREMARQLNELHKIDGVYEDNYPISHMTAYKDAMKNVERWQKQAIINVDKRREVELAKLRKIEAANWKGWRDSLTSVNGPNPSFLRNLSGIVEQRCRLLGLNAPEQVDIQANWAGLLKDEHEHTMIDVEASEASVELEEAAGEAEQKGE